jgi:hypothetical protein
LYPAFPRNVVQLSVCCATACLLPVKIAIYDGVTDPAYSRLLMQKTDLPLRYALALDRV